MLGTFRNVSMCEDVREEVGNKKSLMGVFSGDVVVQELPARLKIAFYAEYIPDQGAGLHEFEFSIRVGSKEAASGKISVNSPRSEVATLILPQGIASIPTPCDIVLNVSGAGETRELIRKAVRLPD